MRIVKLVSRYIMAGVLLICAVPSMGQAVKPVPQGKFESLNPAFDVLFNPQTKIEVIASGFEWIEGPVWVEKGKMLLASDVMKNIIYKWTAKKGKEVYLQPSGYTHLKPRGKELGSNGLALDTKGRLVISQHGDRRIALMDASVSHPKPKYITLAGTV